MAAWNAEQNFWQKLGKMIARKCLQTYTRLHGSIEEKGNVRPFSLVYIFEHFYETILPKFCHEFYFAYQAGIVVDHMLYRVLKPW